MMEIHVSEIQDYFEYIIKIDEAFTTLTNHWSKSMLTKLKTGLHSTLNQDIILNS